MSKKKNRIEQAFIDSQDGSVKQVIEILEEAGVKAATKKVKKYVEENPNLFQDGEDDFMDTVHVYEGAEYRLAVVCNRLRYIIHQDVSKLLSSGYKPEILEFREQCQGYIEAIDNAEE